MNSSLFFLLIIVGAIIFFFIYKKNKKEADLKKSSLSNRKNKDEVWRTIKEFLRTSDASGQEITNSWYAKRMDCDFVSPHMSNYLRKKKITEIDLRRWQYKKIYGKKYTEDFKKKDIYVICFQTRNTKTNTYNTPRAIECEVIRKKISKNNYDQKIIITREVDFDTEMEWIAPIRSYEIKRNEKTQKLIDKIESKKQAKLKKKKEKQLKKSKQIK